MRTLSLSLVTLTGLVLAYAMPASAALVTPIPNGIHAGAAASVQTVYYYWNHRRYRHRRWDRRYHRWYYY
ncbi:MAG: hypothetical protein M3Y41_08440 [Pseudomonadota bacterium]|nr:hypothetical protein [Pseudomonadota bacterium]